MDAEAQVAVMAPKVEQLAVLEASEGAHNLRVAAKTLGVQERRLGKWLALNGWAFRQNGHGPLQAYAQRVKDGFLEHKIRTFTGSDGEPRTASTLMITAKGMTLLAKYAAKGVI